MRRSPELAASLARLNAASESEARGVASMHRQLRMQTALLAALTWQRTGVRPKGFDHLALPDPFTPLVPYCRALVAIQSALAGAEQVAPALAVDPSRSTPNKAGAA